MLSSGRRQLSFPESKLQNTTVLLLIMVQAGDIELNPGPKQSSVFPCGLCQIPVTWSNEGVCCDCCSVWHHKSCIELCTADYELLQRSNVQWMCCKCDSLNVSSFTYHSYEIDNVSYYEPLTTTESFQDSFMSQFSPLKTSSPKVTQNRNSVSEDIPRYTKPNNSDSSKTDSRISNNSNKKNESSPFLHIPPKRNLRILTVNCRSIRDKTSEFKATLNYTKPDIVIGTESWLKGIKPGQNPSKDAIKSSEIFPENYTSFRNDRGTLGGGVFILVQNNIIATEQPQYVTDCEIDWVKIKLKNQKDLLIGGFYMPHRNTKDMEELEKSLKIITDENNNNNIILAGDFNCPDITWETLSLKMDASDKEIQRTLIDTVNVVIFAGGKFRENVGKTFHVGVMFTIMLLFPS